MTLDSKNLYFTKQTTMITDADCLCKAVIDIIVHTVSNAEDEDLCVILCGTMEGMKEISRVNAKLSRLFPLEEAFVFEDLSLRHLEYRLELRVVEEGLRMSPAAKKSAMARVRQPRGDGPPRGYADVEVIVSQAIERQKLRISGERTASAEI